MPCGDGRMREHRPGPAAEETSVVPAVAPCPVPLLYTASTTVRSFATNSDSRPSSALNPVVAAAAAVVIILVTQSVGSPSVGVRVRWLFVAGLLRTGRPIRFPCFILISASVFN